MRKIGIEIDLNLKEILEELIECKFYLFSDVMKYEIEDLSGAILDMNDINFENKLYYFSRKNIPVVLLCSRDDNFKKIKGYLKRGEIYDCIYRDDYFEIEKILEEIFLKEESVVDIKYVKEIVINDNFYKAIIKIEDIIYIDYCRISRKTEIKTKNGRVYSSKKGFSEVEEKLKDWECFVRLDRGTIINKKLLKEIDYKREKITFEGEETLSVSRNKIKNLEENLDLFRNRIEL
ncbi:LytTR family transcriptional regulator DNA-binding domain-containing protein [uncultured Cetobacterium sp.]|uniref:LytTR family transcriptional regulator DNA-binding domain-containing protein n=1 Tax=uncultured Cetobacterium sp. TaxID=527638 RepID=UPI0026024B27|nr:LytTR family transcriptional regulator DNA-binding domain-containing protein [uncultured Cetobacterium sp.]